MLTAILAIVLVVLVVIGKITILAALGYFVAGVVALLLFSFLLGAALLGLVAGIMKVLTK